jgi:ornithine cyclodeaminase/alanine dehydrogenase-like protein (mu-crystallin family)
MPPPTIPILSDEDVRSALSMRRAVVLIEEALRLKAQGALVAPPRFYVGNERGSLAFTAGGHVGQGVIGFRVYETFVGPNLRHEQFVAVFDSTTGELKGLVFGELLGAMRTGAIGGVAIKYAAREDARTIAVIGSGMQARTQLMAAVAVRPIMVARVYSRSAAHRDAFADEMSAMLRRPVVAAASPQEAIEGADIVITATSSASPVVTAEQIGAGVHVNALGPKFSARHEIDPAVADRAAVIFTDSPAQLRGYPEPFFLEERHAISDLADHVASGAPIRRAASDVTLFCSVGLSGTEVVLADAVLRKAAV